MVVKCSNPASDCKPAQPEMSKDCMVVRLSKPVKSGSASLLMTSILFAFSKLFSPVKFVRLLFPSIRRVPVQLVRLSTPVRLVRLLFPSIRRTPVQLVRLPSPVRFGKALFATRFKPLMVATLFSPVSEVKAGL